MLRQVDPSRDTQAWAWWIRGLGGLINIGQQIEQAFGKPDGLDTEVQRLQVLAGSRFTVNQDADNLAITDHKLQRMSWDGGLTWKDGVLGS